MDMTTRSPLLHISTPDDWAAAQHARVYPADSLETEGFIHLSTPAQLLIPANERYAGRTDLILLVIDATRLRAPLVFEDSYGSGIEFPHVYGPIDLEAVERVVSFPPRPDGTFELPVGLD